MGSAGAIKLPGKPGEDSFIQVTTEKCGDVGAVKSRENTKITKKYRTLMY
jgi:hypothetical protein